MEWIAKTDPKLYRAYKLKEALRLVFYNDTVEEASEALTAWIKWARHCRIPAFVELQKKIVRHQSLVAMGTGSMGILLLHLTGYLA